VSLTVLTEAVADDLRSWCEVSVEVGSDVHALSLGDTVLVWVREADLVSSTVLWSTEFEVSAQEVNAGVVDRTLTCTSNFGADWGTFLEVFAEVADLFASTTDPRPP
jgi:hypothetical protein